MKSAAVLFFLFLAPLVGCADMGIRLPLANDPLTGGQNATTSLLLEAPLPTGMQRYASHGFQTAGPQGQRHGLETFRGNVEADDAAAAMFNGLRASGWHLRMQGKKGGRAVYVYEKGPDLGVLVFHRQGLMTIMEIWRSTRLADGASPQQFGDAEGIPSIAGEEYGPLDDTPNTSPQPGSQETWGKKNLEEKPL